MRHQKNILHSAAIVSAYTVLSRITGLIRDMVISTLLGTSHSADALFIAYRIPNLLRRLTADGAVTAAFIPVFTEEMDKNGREKAMRIAGSFFYLISLLLAVAAVAGIVFSREILSVYALGFRETAGKIELAVLLNRIMFPYMILISASALAMGILNSLHIFAPSAAGPILLNLATIACAFTLTPFFQEKAVPIAIGVVAGGILQVIIQIPALVRSGFSFWPRGEWRHPAIRKMSALMLPGLFGTGITQINVFIDSSFGSLLGEGAVAALYTSDRLMEFIQGVYTVALATALVPALSRLATQKDDREFGRTLFFGMRLVTFLALPATMGLIFLGRPIVQVLFERGRFDRQSTELTAFPLACFAVGLMAFAALKIITPAFYALRDTRTPVLAALVALVVNLVSNCLLLSPLGVGGPAMSTSIAALVQFLILYLMLRRQLPTGDEKVFFLHMGKFLSASLPMLAWLLFCSQDKFWVVQSQTLRFLWLCLCILGAIALYLGSAHLLRCPEISELRHFSPFGKSLFGENRHKSRRDQRLEEDE